MLLRYPARRALFEQRVVVERANAIDMGFDVTKLEQLIEREIDAPMRWTAATTSVGGSASGYQSETWIQGKLKLSGWYEHVELDPERCAANTCSDAATGEVTCSDRLELGIEGEFRTRDGAVSALLSGYVLQGRAGFPFGDVAAGSLRADLHDVNGVLEIAPPSDMTLVEALLMTDVYFEANQTEGSLRPYMLLTETAGSAAEYVPLSGYWPDMRAQPVTQLDASAAPCATDSHTP